MKNEDQLLMMRHMSNAVFYRSPHGRVTLNFMGTHRIDQKCSAPRVVSMMRLSVGLQMLGSCRSRWQLGAVAAASGRPPELRSLQREWRRLVLWKGKADAQKLQL